MNREEMLKEARTIEAMKHGYVGMEGKFATIAKRLGTQVIKHGSLNFEQNYLDDPFDLQDENELPTMHEDDNSFPVGLHFDGLSKGVNLSIYVYFHNREIICEYEGRTVYRENSGELEGYVPSVSWESKIDGFYTQAKELERMQKPIEKRKLLEQANKKRQEILHEFKMKWGLS